MSVLEKDIFDGMSVVALAGGVGGAKLARGLTLALKGDDLTVVVNTGDDFMHMGLWISPDLDSVCYGLAALNDPVRGWGLAGESWTVFEQLKARGGPEWFQLGDKDLATHLMRTQFLAEGKSLSEATAILCQGWGINARVLPMSDAPCPTRVELKDGRVLDFQHYFVGEACKPQVKSILLPQTEAVDASQAVLQALWDCDLIVICPSNPWLSIDPILNAKGMREAMAKRPVVAVSPFIGGQAVKGPAAKMAAELGFGSDANALVYHYQGLLKGLLADRADRELSPEAQEQGIILKRSDILMKDDQDKRRVAEEVLKLGLNLIAERSS
ncbi:MAG: 2-phospho-L-lactate transferase [Anaerolineaceae bacterium]|nr:2-phospho-L-lactate transferase [Anaerolineaceae bacterium]